MPTETSRRNKGVLNIVRANTSIQDYQGGFTYGRVDFCKKFVQESLPRDGIDKVGYFSAYYSGHI